jgi:hypothetical protein
MKRILLILILASVWCFAADQVYITDIVQPSNATIVHATDSASNGIQVLPYDAVGFCLLNNYDSAVVYYNPRWTIPNTTWIGKPIAKYQDVGALFRRLNWTLMTHSSCPIESLIVYKRPQ